MCELQEDLQIRLPATPSALRQVRELVRKVAGHEHIGAEHRERAVLVASEAAANVVRHTQSTVIDLAVSCDGEHMLLRVADTDPTPIPTLEGRSQNDPKAPSGRGLLIIDQLASRWDVRSTADGKEVWIETST